MKIELNNIKAKIPNYISLTIYYSITFRNQNFSWNRIEAEVHDCGKFGLGLAIDMIPISTCDSDQAPDLYGFVADENINNGREQPVTTKNEICRRRMTDLVQELVDIGDL